MHTVPTFTESGGHLTVPAPADTAAPRQTAVQPTTMYLRNPVMVLPSLSPPHPASRSWATEPAAVVPTRPRALPARPNGRRPARRPLQRGRSNRVNTVQSGSVAGRRGDGGHVRRRVGAIDAEVALPVEVLCTLLGIDPGRLAAAVRTRATRPDRARSSAHLRDRSSGGAGHARATRGELGITRSRAEAHGRLSGHSGSRRRRRPGSTAGRCR